jgi:predicted RNA polymerase sigma factor
MTNEELVAGISAKITVLTRLIAYQTVSQMTLSEGAPLLKRLGFSNSEIAAIYETSANTVAVRLTEAKKRVKRGS